MADVISKKVLEKLEPRFADIDRKLAADKLRIDDHDAKLANQSKKVAEIDEGQKVLCRGILALLSHEVNGNSIDKLKASQQEIQNYLINK